MDSSRLTYCRICGAGLPAEGEFCESCGARIPSQESLREPSEPIETFGPEIPIEPIAPPVLKEFVLPDPAIPPNPGRALSIGWSMLNEDIVGGGLTGLVFVILAFGSGTIPFVGDLILGAPIEIGFIGWSETRRQGQPTGIGMLFSIGYRFFSDAILLRIMTYGIGLIIAVPFLFFYISTLMSVMMPPPAPGLSPSVLPSTYPFSPGSMFSLGLSGLAALVIGPLVQSFRYLAGWAITKGIPFKPAARWAWLRLRSHMLGWWWAGFIVTFIGGIGVILCYAGLLITLPLTYLAFAELAGYEGDGETG